MKIFRLDSHIKPPKCPIFIRTAQEIVTQVVATIPLPVLPSPSLFASFPCRNESICNRNDFRSSSFKYTNWATIRKYR